MDPGPVGSGAPARPPATMERGTGHQKRNLHISKSPSGLPWPEGGPIQGASNGPLPPTALCPQAGNPLSNGKHTLESAGG